jgi:hypothetical protein
MAIAPASALAHSDVPEQAPAAGAHVPEAVQEALGDDVRAIGDGLYEVDPARGPDIVTHGPDLKTEIAASTTAASTATGFDPGDPERAPACATDYYQHVLYAHPSGTDRFASVKASIQAAMRRTNAVLNDESFASGNRIADYKVLCDSSGNIKVDSFTSNSGEFSSIASAARAAGFNESNADYTIFYDGSLNGYCGVGSYSEDESLGADNLNNRGGDYAIAYRGCWFDETPMHENGHNQGAVQYGAPYSSGAAHCYDEQDVMCYDDGGELIPLLGLRSRCAVVNHFDCGYDSYFDTAPEPGEYLASHWNLGSPLNRFIQIGAPENYAPTAAFSVACIGLLCTFTDRSTDPDGTIATRSWSFGDGTVAQEVSPSHTFLAAGARTVTLTVTDDDGASSSTSHSATSADPAAIQPALVGLSNGAAVSSQSASAAGWRYFKLRVPSNRRKVVFSVNGPDCDAVSCPAQLDLYVRRGSRPTLSAKKCASTSPGSDERCRIGRPRSGTWYAGVRTARGAAHVAFTIVGRHAG